MKKKPGRPSKLSNKVIAQVEILAGLELTEEEISQVIGVTALTIRNWKSNREFLSALKRGKAITDTKVTKSLVQRALGYKYKEITREPKITYVYDAKGKVKDEIFHKELVVTKIVEKQVAPDVVAQIFWLKNRKKDLWRDHQMIVNIEQNQFFTNIIAKKKLTEPSEVNRIEAYSGNQN